MGNTILSQQASSQILNKYWRPISPGLFRNKATHQTIKQKKMTFRSQDEMKYVFNCLLKRMNNYNPHVIKVVYLRKMEEKGSLCDCGKRFTIFVYVENVKERLRNFVERLGNGGEKRAVGESQRSLDSSLVDDSYGFIKQNHQQQSINNLRPQHNKCICLKVLKGAIYLKQRYGPFRVTPNNIWVQPKKPHQCIITTPAPNNTQNSTHQISQTSKPQPHQTPLSSPSQSSNQNSPHSSSPLKPKLWISCEQQQTFPDESCEQKEMCMSIVEVIQHSLVPAGLCKCYHERREQVERLMAVSRLKELMGMVEGDHGVGDGVEMAQGQVQGIGGVQQQQEVGFQRKVRSFSSNQPGYDAGFHPQASNQRIINHDATHHTYNPHYQQPAPQRKYTSIEYVRRAPAQSTTNNMTAQRKPSAQQPPPTHRIPDFFNHFVSNSTTKPSVVRNQQPKHSSFHVPKTTNGNESSLMKSDQSLGKGNENKTAFRFYDPVDSQQVNEIEKRNVNLQQLRGAPVYNTKIKYRHGNNLQHRPIIGIADMPPPLSIHPINQNKILPTTNQPPTNTIQSQPSPLPIDTRNQNITLSPINQLPTDRDPQQLTQRETLQQIASLIKIDLSSDPNRKIAQVSLDKGTNPTDRTKFEISSKGESKKSGGAIDSSRKNISIAPISLESTHGPWSMFKPGLYSHDHLHKPVDLPVQQDFQEVLSKREFLVSGNQEARSKKESASSSKSEQNFVTYQGQSGESNQEREKMAYKKKLSGTDNVESRKISSMKSSSSKKMSSESNLDPNNPTNPIISSQPQPLSTPNTTPYLQTLIISSQNNDNPSPAAIGRLRQSEYIISAMNSFMNSKSTSKKQSPEYSMMSEESLKQKLVKEDKEHYGQGNQWRSRENGNMCAYDDVPMLEFKTDGDDRRDREMTVTVAMQNSSNNPNSSGFMTKRDNIEEHQSSSGFKQYDDQEQQQEQYYQQNQKKLQPSINNSRTSSRHHYNQQNSSIFNNLQHSQKSQNSNNPSNNLFSHPDPSTPLPSSPPLLLTFKKSISQKLPSFIALQQQQPLNPQHPHQPHQQYHVKIVQSADIRDYHSVSNHQLSQTFDNTHMAKYKSLKEEFSNLLDGPGEEAEGKALTENKGKFLRLDQNEEKETYSIYNESEYNNSENVSKGGHSQKEIKVIANNQSSNNPTPPLPVNQASKRSKWRKPFSKTDLQKQMNDKKEATRTLAQQAHQLLRLTSSGHEDSSIKQKVISKKAEFAELKNQMNSLLF